MWYIQRMTLAAHALYSRSKFCVVIQQLACFDKWEIVRHAYLGSTPNMYVRVCTQALHTSMFVRGVADTCDEYALPLLQACFDNKRRALVPSGQ